MVFDVSVVIGLGCHEVSSYKMTNLIDKGCLCPDCSIKCLLPDLSPCPQASLFPETQTEIRPVGHPTMTSQCSSEGNSPPSLTVSQKLEMIKLDENGTLKAEISWGQTSCTRQPTYESKGKFLEGN